MPPKPCTSSWIFNRQELLTQAQGTNATGLNQAILNLCDRVPPGKYAIVRTPHSLSEIALKATILGLRGVVLLLGDSEDPPRDSGPSQYWVAQIQHRPDSTGRPWQVLQAYADGDVLPYPGTNEYLAAGQLQGLQTLRTAKLVVGGYFRIGAHAYTNPAAAGRAIAGIRNLYNLDFVVADLSLDTDAWRGQYAGNKILTLTQVFHQTTIRGAVPPELALLSPHTPLFLGLPDTEVGNSALLSSDGLFEPLVNGYTGPKTFPMPRVSSSSDLNAAYQWGTPLPDGSSGIGRAEFIVSSTDPNVANLVTILANGFSISFAGGQWNPYAGLIVYDDFNAPSFPGDAPNTYWDYDRFPVLEGTIVPSFWPDPPPTPTVGNFWVGTVGGAAASVVFTTENWKTGHTDDLRRPNWMQWTEAGCDGQRSTLRSWLQVNGSWLTTPYLGGISFGNTYAATIPNAYVTLSGYPTTGDSGNYTAQVELRKDFTTSDMMTRFVYTTAVLDPGLDPAYPNVYPTGFTSPYPLLAPEEADSWYHPMTPRPMSSGRIPDEWLSPADWCAGVVAPYPDLGITIPVHGIPPPDGSTCLFPYYTNVIKSALDICGGWGWHGSTAYCSDTVNANLYAGFVFAVVATVSLWNNAMTTSDHVGLFQLSSSRTGANPASLESPAYATNLASSFLDLAWQDAANACGNSYQDQVYHALNYYLDISGLVPGAHGGDYDISATSTYHRNFHCSKLTEYPNHVDPAGIAVCFAGSINSGGFQTTPQQTTRGATPNLVPSVGYFPQAGCIPVAHPPSAFLTSTSDQSISALIAYANANNFPPQLLIATGYLESHFDSTAAAWGGGATVCSLLPAHCCTGTQNIGGQTCDPACATGIGPLQIFPAVHGGYATGTATDWTNINNALGVIGPVWNAQRATICPGACWSTNAVDALQRMMTFGQGAYTSLSNAQADLSINWQAYVDTANAIYSSYQAGTAGPTAPPATSTINGCPLTCRNAVAFHTTFVVTSNCCNHIATESNRPAIDIAPSPPVPGTYLVYSVCDGIVVNVVTDGNPPSQSHSPDACSYSPLPCNEPTAPGIGYGNMLEVACSGSDIHVRYGHLTSMNVALGDTVHAGNTPQDSPIGTMGSTGCSTGQHLHFEMLKNCVPFCPDIEGSTGRGTAGDCSNSPYIGTDLQWIPPSCPSCAVTG